MEEKINKIWYQMNMKQITSEEARQQVLDLFAVMPTLHLYQLDTQQFPYEMKPIIVKGYPMQLRITDEYLRSF